jgi:adenylate kinase
MARAVMIYGAPGSGKGTQAYLLEAAKGFFHFDTGMYLEQVVHDSANAKNKEIQRERKLFDSGILLTPSWVLSVVKKKAGAIAKAGLDIVFSGSPRTLFEAFGDVKNEGLISFLEKAYGRKNLHFFVLKVSKKTSIWRNSHRQICSTCGAPVLYRKNGLPHCGFCGSPLRRRTLDKPEIIKVRLKEYQERTEPIIAKLKKMGYKVNAINGESAPYKVFKQIIKRLNNE